MKRWSNNGEIEIGWCLCNAYSVSHLIGRGNCPRGRCDRCDWSLDQCMCRTAERAKAGAK